MSRLPLMPTCKKVAVPDGLGALAVSNNILSLPLSSKGGEGNATATCEHAWRADDLSRLQAGVPAGRRFVPGVNGALTTRTGVDGSLHAWRAKTRLTG